MAFNPGNPRVVDTLHVHGDEGTAGAGPPWETPGKIGGGRLIRDHGHHEFRQGAVVPEDVRRDGANRGSASSRQHDIRPEGGIGVGSQRIEILGKRTLTPGS